MFSNAKKSLNLDQSIIQTEASNQIQSIKSVGNQPRTGVLSPNVISNTNAPAISTPAHVSNVRVQVKPASDVTSRVTVSFTRNPNDFFFSQALVHVSGYKGNSAPTQVASGQSPISFSLENTGEPVSVKVQASGSLGPAPLQTAPNATLQLRSTPLATVATVAGNGTAPPSTGTVAGMNVADLPWNNWSHGSTSPLATAGFTYCQVMFANSIQFFANSWTVSIWVTTAVSAAIGEMCVIRTLKDSLTTVDVTPIKFGGSATPTFGTTGVKVSDAVSLPIDAIHDYYFCFTGNTFGGSGNIAADNNSSGPNWTSFVGNCNSGTPRSSAWASSIGAGGGFSGAFPLGFDAYFLTAWTLVT